jgi:NADH-quinone oxidoreductase subunit J
VGAVAVLFLFVVMMLDIDFAALRAGFARYLPVGAAVALVLVIEMAAVSVGVASRGAAAGATAAQPGAVTNAEAIGRVLYTDYVYFFQAAGMILLVAMIGAIVLTLKHRVSVRRQNIADQTARTPATGMRMVNIKSGEGIEL